MARFGGTSRARNVRMHQGRLDEEPACRGDQRIPNVEADQLVVTREGAGILRREKFGR